MSATPVRMFLPVPAVAGLLLLVAGGSLREIGSPAGAPVLVAGVVALVTVALMFWRTIAGGVMAAGVWMVALAWAAGTQVPAAYGPSRLQTVLFGAAGVVLVVMGWRTGRRPGTRTIMAHHNERSERNDGVASPYQLWRHASTRPIRRKALVLRPSLAEVPFYKRRFVPIEELGTRLARVGRFGVWSSIEDVTLRLGPPRQGKSGEIACRIVDAPGAVIATSTRTDLIELTGAYRAETRGPVYVFNPSGMAGADSSIAFNPLVGCEDPVTAGERAGDMLSAVGAPGGGDDRAYWTEQAQRVLATLMHAAAIENAAAEGTLSMRDVLSWVADPDGSKDEVQRYLRRSPEPAFVADSLQFLNTNDRTRSSICSTIMPALGWLTNPNAVAAATGGGFDVARLLAERGTVYMLGAEDAKTAPLVTALTGHIARQARAIATRMPKGRLDPPLTLVLDEAALICPVPLDKWTADMGGRNITIHIAAQSKAQLEAKFGETGARTILNNTGTLMLFGASKDAEDMQAFSTVIGDYAEDVETVDESTGHRSTSNRRSSVLGPGRLRELEFGQVVILARAMPVAIGRVDLAWKRGDLRWFNAKRKATHLAATCRDGLVEGYTWVRPGVVQAYRWCEPRARVAYAAARPHLAEAVYWSRGGGRVLAGWIGEHVRGLGDWVLTLKRQVLRQHTGGPSALVRRAAIALPPAAADVALDLSDRPRRADPAVDELVDDDANATVTSIEEWKKGDAS